MPSSLHTKTRLYKSGLSNNLGLQLGPTLSTASDRTPSCEQHARGKDDDNLPPFLYRVQFRFSKSDLKTPLMTQSNRRRLSAWLLGLAFFLLALFNRLEVIGQDMVTHNIV